MGRVGQQKLFLTQPHWSTGHMFNAGAVGAPEVYLYLPKKTHTHPTRVFSVTWAKKKVDPNLKLAMSLMEIRSSRIVS
jgi:hypothetical protein